MNINQHDVLAYMSFPVQNRTKLYQVNLLERLTKELKRRADVVAIFPNEASIIRLKGAVLLEADDGWKLQQHYMQVEVMADIAALDATIEHPAIPLEAA